MIESVPETGSTNADLAAKILDGDFVSEGDWLVADVQTAGRGRQGREWFDGLGNFMGSTVVQQRFGDLEPHTLALVSGLAVFEAMAWHAPDSAELKLKWPNDLLAGDAKLAGILLERVADATVVGIGVNLVSAPEILDRKTASLKQLGGSVTRDVFAADLAKSFETELDRWRSFGLAPLVKRWVAAAHPIGTMLTVVAEDKEQLSGAFAGLDESGALQLRLADGYIRAIHAGEVLLDQRKN